MAAILSRPQWVKDWFTTNRASEVTPANVDEQIPQITEIWDSFDWQISMEK